MIEKNKIQRYLDNKYNEGKDEGRGAGAGDFKFFALPSKEEEKEFIKFLTETIGYAHKFKDAITQGLDESAEKALQIIFILIQGAIKFASLIGSGKSSEGDIAGSIFGTILSIIPFLFEEGGEIRGRSHAQGGVPILAEGGEFMIRKSRVTPETIPLLRLINGDTTGALRSKSSTGFIYGTGGRVNTGITGQPISIILSGEMSEMQSVKVVTRGLNKANVRIGKRTIR
jgi:hypothetical protein